MSLLHSMQHRHISTQEYTLTAIDDIISRGKHHDWIELRDAVRADVNVAVAVKKVCDNYVLQDEIRYAFWPVYLRHAGYGYLYEEKPA